MSQSTAYQIESFPQDDKLWRVIWLSNVVINALAKTEPLISVYLQKVDGFDSTNAKNSFLEIQIGIGHLSLVYIGSIWKNGIIDTISNKYDSFNLEVDTSEAKPIIFWQSTDNTNKRIITSDEYPTSWQIFSKIKESPLIAIPYGGDPYGLLIPAIEVIRFYYLVSSPMAIAIFYGAFETLVKSTPHFDVVTQDISIELNSGLGKNDLWVIARYWTSALVKNRINDIHDWVQKNSINGTERVSKSTFLPFDGKLKLKFQGKIIEGADGVKRFLCTRLTNCTSPFLFNKANLIERVRSKALIKATEEPARAPTHWPIYKQESTNIINSNEKPSKRFFTKIIVDAESRFEGIKNKLLEVEAIDRDSERFPKILFNSSESKKISTANGAFSSSNTRPANITTDLNLEDLNSKTPERLTAFIRVLNYLRSEKGMSVKTIAIQLPESLQNIPGYRPVELFKFEDEIIVGCFSKGNKKNTWVQLKVGTIKKPRGIFIVEVKHNSKTWYLMELEQHEEKSNDCYSLQILYNAKNSEIHNDIFYSFVLDCGVKKGWPSIRKDDAALLRTMTIKHQANLGEKIAAKLI